MPAFLLVYHHVATVKTFRDKLFIQEPVWPSYALCYREKLQSIHNSSDVQVVSH